MGILIVITATLSSIVCILFFINVRMLMNKVDCFASSLIEDTLKMEREIKRYIMEKNEETKSELVRIFVKETKEEKEKNTKRSESAKRMWAERKKKAAEQDVQQPPKASNEQH